jgi:calcium-dependent protein kinase
MELCTGGTLLERVKTNGTGGKFSENVAAPVMRQILQAVNYMHKLMICHRDLKLENFLFVSKDPVDKAPLKMIDFGLACRCRDGQKLSVVTGSALYIAPEVIESRYDQRCDLWSCGVIMYILLSGQIPFHAQTRTELFNKIRLGRFSLATPLWEPISTHVKGLLRGLMEMKPESRLTAHFALKHPWVCACDTVEPNSDLSIPSVSSIREGFAAYGTKGQLAQVALRVCARQLDEHKLAGIQRAFARMDKDGDGRVSPEELEAGFRAAGTHISRADLMALVNAVDANGNGVIDYTEFLAATLEQEAHLQEDICRKSFQVFDLDGNGTISSEELRLLLAVRRGVRRNIPCCGSVGTDVAGQLMREADKNRDGSIDFEEFKAILLDATTLHQDTVAPGSFRAII